MRVINSQSIQYIRKNYLGNLSLEDKKLFSHKLERSADEWSKFLVQKLDAQNPVVIGTSLILFFELTENIDSKTRNKIANLLEHHDEWVRERASEAISKFATKSVLPMIVGGLKDKNAFVRGYLCEALGRIKSDVSSRLILKHLQDRDGLVRTSAIESAQKLRLKKAIPLLERRLDDREPLVRGYAASALCVIKGEKSKLILLKRLKKERDWFAKIQILESLYHLSGSKDILETILKMFSSPQSYIRDGVITALENIVDKLNINRILDVLKQALKVEPKLTIKKRIKSRIMTLNAII